MKISKAFILVLAMPTFSFAGTYTAGGGKTSGPNQEHTIAIGEDAETTSSDSVAIGDSATSGNFATALGKSAKAGYGDTAIGFQAQATGGTSTALGANAIANSGNATAIGMSTQAGYFGTAVGPYANAIDGGSGAFGYGAKAGSGGYAIGHDADAEGYDSFAAGNFNSANSDRSVAIGSYSHANADYSVALGSSSIASRGNAVSVGNDVLKRQIINVANGDVSAESTDVVNGSQLYTTNQEISKVNVKVDSVQTQVNNIAVAGKNNVAYTDDSHEKISLSSTEGGATSLSGVKDGNIAAGSTEAVNGSQLWNTNQQVGKNTTHINNLENKINDSGVGILQKDNTTKEITIGKNDDGKKINIEGTDGYRVITGVADGSGTTDAVNYGQLQRSSTQSRNYSDQVGARTLNQANTYTDSKIRSLDKKINRKNQKQDAGIASAVAIGSIPQNWQYQDHLGMGLGGYNGQGSVAAKYGHKIQENLAVSLSVGLDTTGNAAYGAGFDFGW